MKVGGASLYSVFVSILFLFYFL
uniref:Uncharacterized protein n=1 Tax=Anguilla anguilla TaxID=7936 RepID=A0A0E9SZ27_ANGAN